MVPYYWPPTSHVSRKALNHPREEVTLYLRSPHLRVSVVPLCLSPWMNLWAKPVVAPTSWLINFLENKEHVHEHGSFWKLAGSWRISYILTQSASSYRCLFLRKREQAIFTTHGFFSFFLCDGVSGPLCNLSKIGELEFLHRHQMVHFYGDTGIFLPRWCWWKAHWDDYLERREPCNFSSGCSKLH